MPTESPEIDPCYQLANGNTSLIVDCRHRLPALVYFGPPIHHFTADNLGLLDRGDAPAALPGSTPLALLPDASSGFLGHPGIATRRGRTGWQLHPVVRAANQLSPNQLNLEAYCQVTEVGVRYELMLDPDLPIVALRVCITNQSSAGKLAVDECNITVPVPDHLTHCSGFGGRWGLEFQAQTQAIQQGAHVRENRSGRTSHQSPPYLMVHQKGASETLGEVLACHLAWSGNSQIRVEQLSDGRRYMQLGELLTPGEIDLEPGAVYTSPTVWCAATDRGRGGLSDSWHQLVRDRFPNVSGLRGKARPVQFNTWEATYFDFNEARLLGLIESAGDLGIERFVLDDGWFLGRNSDGSSLGDWQVDREKLPGGLNPLIAACQDQGMEFGLWIEPEMVSPDSDLYRRHPDWVLNHDPLPRLLARQQLVLDLGRGEVQEYLFEVISDLLSSHAITYLKWDMNREIHQAGNAEGHPAVHRQIQSLYGLLERLKLRFPDVEIESCASGGGRVDLGVLPYVSRFWTSDSNDALDRLVIQRGFSLFLPPEVMGCHIGSQVCHLTGRRHTLAFRGGVALWGHLGIEMDPDGLDQDDEDTLRALIELYKRHRALLHGGRALRIDRPDGEMAWAVVDGTQAEGLFAAARLYNTVDVFPRRYRFRGLDETACYRVRLVWPNHYGAVLSSHATGLAREPIPGAVLVRLGIELPIMAPETLFIYHLERVQESG